jgi:hypothetical protein
MTDASNIEKQPGGASLDIPASWVDVRSRDSDGMLVQSPDEVRALEDSEPGQPGIAPARKVIVFSTAAMKVPEGSTAYFELLRLGHTPDDQQSVTS